ncbi:MAG: DUF1707 SHOCT-like domain-containing protein [Propionibacteriaceae bacterium]
MNGNLRASDADRDAVAEVLHAAYAEGRLTIDEHDDRVSTVLAAKTFAELAPLTEDLVVTRPAELVAKANQSAVIVEEGATDGVDAMNVFMSTVNRTGPWRMRTHSTSNNFMGTVKLDLTEATFDAPVVEIQTTLVMGTLLLRVPEGTRVKDEATNMMASTTIKEIGTPDPSMPLIVIRGNNFMGDIKVRGPKKSSAWRKTLGH